MSVNRTSIVNGCVKSNTGFRNVAITSSGSTRPVLYVRRSGFMTDRCTVQTAAPGDYVVSSSVWKGEVNYTISSIQADLSQRTLGSGTFDEVIACIGADVVDKDSIRQFLSDVANGRSSSFLPANVGWDGVNSIGDINKDRRIRAFFSYLDSKKVDKIAKAAMVSAREGLYTDWNRAQKMPSHFSTYKYSWDGCVVDMNTCEHWVLFYEDGTFKYCIFDATEGEWGSNYAYTDRGVYNAEPVPVGDNVVKAIKIRYGAYTRAEEHTTYGVAWTLYKK